MMYYPTSKGHRSGLKTIIIFDSEFINFHLMLLKQHKHTHTHAVGPYCLNGYLVTPFIREGCPEGKGARPHPHSQTHTSIHKEALLTFDLLTPHLSHFPCLTLSFPLHPHSSSFLCHMLSGHLFTWELVFIFLKEVNSAWRMTIFAPSTCPTV